MTFSYFYSPSFMINCEGVPRLGILSIYIDFISGIDSGSRCITISRILLSSPCFDFLRSEDHTEDLCLTLIVESSAVRI